MSVGNIGVEELLRRHGAEVPQARLHKDAIQGCWAINYDEVKIGQKLGSTFKSNIFWGTWQGLEVVVKCPSLQQKGMAKNQSKGASLEGEQDVAKTAEDQEKELLHEISILQSLRHPDLVMFL